MFTGVIQFLGTVETFTISSENAVLTLSSQAFSAAELARYALKIGDSVAISGVCLTVISSKDGEATFEIGSETLRRTSLGRLRVGTVCHVERSLRMGDSLDGHLVFGHVDGTTELLTAVCEGETIRLEFRMPSELEQLIAPKGSITLEGVSLTVGEVSAESLSVYIIPHTAEKTIFGSLSIGDSVNVEIDMIARYVARILSTERA